MNRILKSSFIGVILLRMAAAAFGAELPVLNVTVDFSMTNGRIRALHGVNKGPLAAGATVDLTESYRSNHVPFIRLHDCMWPYPDVVDVHAVFRNPSADPQDPTSYDFALTDEYLAAAHRTGAKLIYRLGESIEHMKAKRFVNPPQDLKKWAQACLGMIRHYNEGWADGFRYGIQYFEIWNEPENRPAMWTGTDEQFLDLYRTAAAEIKSNYPDLKTGGPGFGYSGKFENKTFIPSDFLLKFLRFCRKEGVPLDFLSWHCYTADVRELGDRARAIREVLDLEGFTRTESHLTEWNYLPDNSWSPFSKTSSAHDRHAFYERMSGPEGAAFLVASLIALQDTPTDVSCMFHGELGPFGLYNEFGEPTASYEGIRLFAHLTSPKLYRILIPNTSEDVWMVAATDLTNTFSVLLSNRRATSTAVRIKMGGFGRRSPKSFRITQVPASLSAANEAQCTEEHLSTVLPANSVTRLDANL